MTLSLIPKKKKTIHQLAMPILSQLDQVESEIENIISSDKLFIQELTKYIVEYKGKRIRPAILLLAGLDTGALQYPHIQASAVIELIHTATLVHDDVMDGANIRRHKKTVHQRWSNHTAVMLGDFLYCSSFEMISNWSDSKPFQLLTKTTRQMCEGEILQLHNKHNLDLSRQEYNEIIQLKTASLFAVSCWLGAHLNGLDTKICQYLYQFGESIGMAFQIMDDVIDLIGNEKDKGKSLGTDLKEGKMTLPMLHMMNSIKDPKHQEEVKDMIRRASFKGIDQEINQLLEETKAIDKTIQDVQYYCDHANQMLEKTKLKLKYLPHIADLVVRDITTSS